MKFRNNWKNSTRQWDKVMIRLRVSSLDLFSLEMDIAREFYLLTLFNFTIKNR